MNDEFINEQLRLAVVEKLASYTVGIAVSKNTQIGTGTLVTDGTGRYILTAEHVIKGADVSDIRFFLRPNTALKEKAAIETTNEEVGRMTVGAAIPIVEIRTDPAADIAILTIDDSFVLPDGAEFYHLAKSYEFALWPDDRLDDTSILIYGFPVANSRPITTIGNNTFCFLGTASMISRYSMTLNSTAFKSLSSDVSSEKDFLITYTGVGDGIHPGGFSGCGVWVPTDSRGNQVWSADPLLIGVVHSYFAKSQLIAATKLPSVVTITPA